MRTFEDYKREVLADGKDYIDENAVYFDDWEDCFDGMWNGRVTGNGDGSYFCNSYKAREACAGLGFDTDFLDALEQHFGNDGTLEKCLRDGPEAFDVLVRIIALEEVYGELADHFQERKEV